MSAAEDLRAMEMAREMYEAWPVPRSIDEDNFNPVPWDELPNGAVRGWMNRARNLMRNGWVLAHKDTAPGAVAEIVRLAKEFIGDGAMRDTDYVGFAWSDDGADEEVDAAISALIVAHEPQPE